jgi:hypothetical protein
MVSGCHRVLIVLLEAQQSSRATVAALEAEDGTSA